MSSIDSSALLVPSQAMSSNNGASVPSNQEAKVRPTTTSARTRKTRGGRRRGRDSSSKPPGMESNPDQAATSEEVPKQNKKQKQKQRKKANEMNTTDPKAVDATSAETVPKKKKAKKRNRKPRADRAKFPWRRHIPPGSMDPITLDPLVSLPYPPFALVASEPFVPVSDWPVPDKEEKNSAQQQPEKLTEEERQQRILQEQWGISQSKQAEEESATTGEDGESSKQHYNLFDGRALAYYLVSQLQFIDPFNRRDLTRDELLNLDAYLVKHGFTDVQVVEAYDAKGITISRSGAVGATAAGRAAILQQEAQGLLNALFGGHTAAAPQPRNQLRQQYTASQAPQRRTSRRRNQAALTHDMEDSGIYGTEDGGMIVIDDDVNPGLRGAGVQSLSATSNEFVPGQLSHGPNTLWSASHITSQYSHNATVQERNFPALPTPSTNTNSGSSAPSARDAKPEKAPSKSLQRIVKAVPKTDPAEVKRQLLAREEARRRAMLANLSFASGEATLPSSGMSGSSERDADRTVSTGPTEGQLARNQALASALGVAPATMRKNYNEGWQRPADGTIQLDEFGNELNAAQYPDSLILAARERMDQLLKLERRWKTFLSDDKSASLPLRPMDRPLRKFVHEYSDFWKLHTESFDPEPKRYIHCVKLRDTSAPVPLLSDAARHWRGPSQQPLVLPRGPRESTGEGEHSSSQTAGQATQSREFPPPPEREPLKLKPRSEVIAPPEATLEMNESDPTPNAALETSEELNTRFSDLFSGRERPKLALAPRTVPLELPPFQPPDTYNIAEERERQQAVAAEKERKERLAAHKKQEILRKAFASSDEESIGSAAGSSEWEEEEQEYSGSDEEE